MKTLLLTTDGSARSWTVLPHARRFASALGLDVRVVRVLDRPAAKRGPQTDAEAEARAQVVVTLDEAGVEWPVEIVTLAQGKNTQTAVREAAARHGAAAIAMHSRGENALRHAILGNVALGIVGATGIPVLVTGGKTSEPRSAGPYHLVIAVDGSTASMTAVNALSELVAGTGITVTLLRVHVPALGDRGKPVEVEECQHQVEALLPRLPAGVQARAMAVSSREFEKVESTIARVAEEIGADAVGLSTHGHSALRHVMLGSVAAGVIGHSHVPALLVRTVD